MLITEGLAELKTLAARIGKKQEVVTTYLFRQEGQKDPLLKDGGSEAVIAKELQAISDMNERRVVIRVGIQKTNLVTTITLGGVTRTISEWLAWRKDVSSDVDIFLRVVRNKLAQARIVAQKSGGTVINVGQTPSKDTDIVVNVNESTLNQQAESLADILGQLDGQLSLKNATVNIEGL